jgi:hypothetical protein
MMLVYTAISVKFSPWLIRAMDKIMRVFLWSGTEVVQGGKCVVAWCQVQQPLHLGGLGIKDIKSQGLSLWMHWLWLQRTGPSRPWHEFPM